MTTAVAIKQLEQRIRHKYIGQKNTPKLRNKIEKEIKGALSKFPKPAIKFDSLLPDRIGTVDAPTVGYVNGNARIYQNIHVHSGTYSTYFNANDLNNTLHVSYSGTPAYGYDTMYGATVGATVGTSYTLGTTTIEPYLQETRRARCKVKVMAPIVSGFDLSKDGSLMKAIRRQASHAIRNHLPPIKVATVMPIGMAHVHGDELIGPSTRTVDMRPEINPEHVHQINEEINPGGPGEDGYITITFAYEIPDDCVIEMKVDRQFIRSFQRESVLDQMRKVIRNRHRVKRGSERTGKIPMPMTAIQAKEEKARETLRDMITESEWRRYLTNGFIMVKAPSGLYYQIFGRGDRIRVYKDNKHIENICIHTDADCPPTDHVINIKVLVEIDENAVRSGGNISLHHNTDLIDSRSQQERLRAGITNHLQWHVGQGTITQDAVDQTKERTKRLAQLQSLRQSSESLVSIYQKIKTA